MYCYSRFFLLVKSSAASSTSSTAKWWQTILGLKLCCPYSERRHKTPSLLFQSEHGLSDYPSSLRSARGKPFRRFRILFIVPYRVFTTWTLLCPFKVLLLRMRHR
ncbi:hypothetical protein GALMADRAFT_742914 [Galerina marginata CBS 339.88]|uniref:Uncharacterized protein n=1 Tax=Galerina marginata (strain CBS 339.88) TaxID=685588 RepID=A0A067SPW9_GALM3|nr:hypothetical protein GALMADRAFT_742914 [Galerina marginata CBS 339.88]